MMVWSEGSSGVERSQHSLTGGEDLHCCEAICEWLFGYKLNTFRPYIVAVVALRIDLFLVLFFFVTKEGKKNVLFCILRFGDERLKCLFDYHLSLPVYLISPVKDHISSAIFMLIVLYLFPLPHSVYYLSLPS